MNFRTAPNTMTAAWYERTGAPHDVLTVGEMPVPEVGPGEVLVRVAVSGLNPHDTKKRAGWLGRRMPAPRIVPHADAAGTVAMVGAGVLNPQIGERVWVVRADIVRPGWGRQRNMPWCRSSTPLGCRTTSPSRSAPRLGCLD